jgi:hypothetical protein
VFFHGVNTGSNPVGDANKIKDLAGIPCFTCPIGRCLKHAIVLEGRWVAPECSQSLG